jgi:Na+-translocating ferredoxin:NAD+ oxidoreductase RnfG subunit
MYMNKIGFISLIVIGLAAVLMVVTEPTIQTQQASAVSQPVVKKVVVVKDPTNKVKSKDPPKKKDPPRKRFVRRCVRTFHGRIICRFVPRFGFRFR